MNLIKYKFNIGEYPTTFRDRTRGTSSVNLINVLKSLVDIIIIKIKS